MLEHLMSLRDHGEWADRRLLDAVRAAPASTAVRELAHIRAAQEIWLSRIEARAPRLALWPELSVAELATIGETLDAAWRSHLSGLAEEAIDEPVPYVSGDGVRHTTPQSEILLHVLLHGQYHRGKASMALRQETGTAVGVDYILWLRNGAPRDWLPAAS